MTQQKVTLEAVRDAIIQLRADNQTVSADRVLERTGGSKPTVLRLMREHAQTETDSTSPSMVSPQLEVWIRNMVFKCIAEAQKPLLKELQEMSAVRRKNQELLELLAASQQEIDELNRHRPQHSLVNSLDETKTKSIQ